MAKYHYRGPSISLFAAQGDRNFAERLLYQTATGFALANADGSKTYLKGELLVWNAATATFSAGVVHAITHYTASGAYIDGIQDLSMEIGGLQCLLDGRGTALAMAALQRALLAGDDMITAEAADDTLDGGDGDDVITGGMGADRLDGGTGNDWASYESSALGVRVSLATGLGAAGDAQGDTLAGIENLRGGMGNDTLTGNAGANILFGRAGNDRLSARAGNDLAIGGDGDDMIWGGRGQDIVKGNSGHDVIDGGSGDDVAVYDYAWSELDITQNLAAGSFSVAAPDGSDRLFSIEFIATTTGTFHFDALTGGWIFDSPKTGGDWLGGVDDGSSVNPPSNVFLGTMGNDTLTGNDAGNAIYGKAGADTLFGRGGDDHIEGGDGGDLIDAGTGRDIVRGGAGNDTIHGGPDPDVIIYDCAWSELTATYSGSDYSIWIVAPDGTDQVFSALTIATATGTYHFDLPTLSWVFQSPMTGGDWLA